ncbi:MAG: UDP-glucose 4-epimerase GalE [Vicinamibacterales bacterium]
MPTVLVTGGAGYIGSHAVKALAFAGHRVVVYDNLSAGHLAAVEAVQAALQRHGRDPRTVSFIHGDVRDTDRLTSTLSAEAAHAVMHFAAWLTVNDSVFNPVGYYDNNVGGALSVLEAMVRAEVRVFVFSSTCAIFGEPSQVPIDEALPKAPINAYGETKLAIERALPHYARAYGLKWVALRYFNAAGADPDGDIGEDHSPEIHIIPRAIDAAFGRGRLAVFGTDYPTPDGTCQRDYIHVTDLADAHLRALSHLLGGGDSEAFNVGNGRPHTVLEVIKAVEAVTGRPLSYAVEPRREGDPAALFASNARIRHALGWRPQYDDLHAIVDTASRWRAAHPHGYGEPKVGQ